MIAPDPRADLCTRLEKMRAELVETMVRDGFTAGVGALLTQIAAALAVLAEPPGSPSAHENSAVCASTGKSASASVGPPARAVLADDNVTVRLTIYSGAAALGEAELDSVHAVRIAGELLAARGALAARAMIALVTCALAFSLVH